MKIMYDKILKNYVYVCPTCFNKPKDCTCTILPLTLVQIDKNIWPTIKLLNEKWYKTEECCEGHVGSSEMIYVRFKKNYRFRPLSPKGFEGDGGYLKASITGNNGDAKKRNKRKLLNALHNWACSLESRNIH